MTTEEAKQAAGGYVKIDIKTVDASTAINAHLKVRA